MDGSPSIPSFITSKKNDTSYADIEYAPWTNKAYVYINVHNSMDIISAR